MRLLPGRPAAATSVQQPECRGPVRLGLLVLALFFGVFGLWAAFAPLDSAAIAPGTVKVDSNRKTVQNLEGGILREILVQEGDAVQAGQALVRFDATQAEASRELYRWQLNALKAQGARLAAERHGLERIVFPGALAEERDRDPRIADILEGQETLFRTRGKALQSQIAILTERIKQYRSQIDGYRAQEEATLRRLALLEEEIRDLEKLVERQISPKATLLTLQRQAAEARGALGDYRAQIARSGQAIGETELEILDAPNAFLNEVATELREVQVQISDVEKRLQAAEDVLRRREVLAPVSGKVVALRHFTPGGVVAPGEAILDIVPRDDQLVIEARVQPIDIDVVALGLEARVRLTAFKQRSTPTLSAKVIHVSADSLTDERSGAPYFTVRVEVDAAQLARIQDVELYPGMPAEIMIVTGERTFLQYLLAPLTDSFARAFREA